MMVKLLKNMMLLAMAGLLLGSCDSSTPEGKGAIVLGDSSTIITEADQQQLKDMVTDLQPVIPPSENKDEEANNQAAAEEAPALPSGKPPPAGSKSPPVASQTQPAPSAQPLPNTPGLKAEFKEVTVMIPGLGAKQGGKPNLEHANGAVYTWLSGDIDGATLRVSGNVTKVSQRYQSVVVLESNMGDLPLDALSVTAKWEQVKGNNNTYPISGLDTKSLKYYNGNASAIRNAVQKAAKRRRMNSRKTQELVNSVRNVRSANQKPLTVKLRSVMWKIDGKDAGGRLYSKQIRVDVPL